MQKADTLKTADKGYLLCKKTFLVTSCSNRMLQTLTVNFFPIRVSDT